MQSIQFSMLRCLCRREKDRRRLRRIKGFLFFIAPEIQLIIEISLLVLKRNKRDLLPSLHNVHRNHTLLSSAKRHTGVGTYPRQSSLATPPQLQNLDHPNQQKQPVPYNQAA